MSTQYAPIWNDTERTFTCLKANVTDTASSSSSLLMDLQVGGSSKLQIAKNGSICIAYVDGANGLRIAGNGGSIGQNYLNTRISMHNNECYIDNGHSGGFTFRSVNSTHTMMTLYPGSNPVSANFNKSISISSSTIITFDAASTLAQRNSTNPQTFRIYNTYTSSTNLESFEIKANTTQYEISSIVGSAGGTNRALAFGHRDSAGTFTEALTIDENQNSAFSGRVTAYTYALNTAYPTGGSAVNTGLELQSAAQIYVNVAGSTSMKINSNAVRANGGILYIGGSGVETTISGNGTSLKLQSGSFTFRDKTDSADADITAGAITASGTLATRNGTSPTLAQVYNTYTSPTNYEALQIKANTTQYEISSIVGSAGGSNRALAFGHTDSAGTFTSALSIATNGFITTAGSISSSGNLTAVGTVYCGSGQRFEVTSRLWIRASDNGTAVLTDNTGADFSRLQLGGTTSSYPAIKRNGTALNFRLADDSADADITAGAITASGDLDMSANLSDIILNNQSNVTYNSPQIRVAGYESGISVWSNANVGIIASGIGVTKFTHNAGLLMNSSLPITWGNALINGAADLALYRDGSGILHQYNSTNPQTWRLGNTVSSSTNREYLQIKANTTQYEISSAVGSAGGSNRALAFGHTNAAGTFTNVFSIDVASNPLLTIASNYTLIATTMQIQSGGQLRGVSGNITLSDHATASTFNLLRFGGTSSSFPAIKRNSTELDFRLADDSAYCNINANGASFANDVTVTGHFSATTKSFLIDHPSKPGKKLQYASLEGPENGVYVRGTADSPTIVLPDYWADLIHEDSITVSLTPLDEFQPLFVRAKSSRAIEVGGSTGRYDYVIYGERKDVARLEVELWA